MSMPCSAVPARMIFKHVQAIEIDKQFGILFQAMNMSVCAWIWKNEHLTDASVLLMQFAQTHETFSME